MNRENVLRWVEALESGDYPQTVGLLHRQEESDDRQAGYCCLGVGCVVAAIPERTTEQGDAVFGAVGVNSMPPEEFWSWLGIGRGSGPGIFINGLAEENDRGVSFPRIAAWIRTRLLDEETP